MNLNLDRNQTQAYPSKCIATYITFFSFGIELNMNDKEQSSNHPLTSSPLNIGKFTLGGLKNPKLLEFLSLIPLKFITLEEGGTGLPGVRSKPLSLGSFTIEVELKSKLGFKFIFI